jgi:hypothetical protein
MEGPRPLIRPKSIDKMQFENTVNEISFRTSRLLYLPGALANK